MPIAILGVVAIGGIYAYQQGYFDQITAKLQPKARAPKKTIKKSTTGTPKKVAPKPAPKKTTPAPKTCKHLAVCPTDQNKVLFMGKCITPAQYLTELGKLNKAHGCNPSAGMYYDVCVKKCVKSPVAKFARVTLA